MLRNGICPSATRGPDPIAGGDRGLRHPAFAPSFEVAERRGRQISLSAWACFPLFLLLSACTVGPNYKRPNVNAPTVFRGPSGVAQQASFADLPWWEVYKDETLKELVKTSLTNNYDLAVDVARVEQARRVAGGTQIAVLSDCQLLFN